MRAVLTNTKIVGKSVDQIKKEFDADEVIHTELNSDDGRLYKRRTSLLKKYSEVIIYTVHPLPLIQRTKNSYWSVPVYSGVRSPALFF